MIKNQTIGEQTQGGQAPVPSVNFHLWKACNMRCKFCFATFADYPKGFLPKGHLNESDATKVVRELAKMGFQKITFAGGEPTLCSWLDKLLKEAKILGMNTMIVTNGQRLTREWIFANRKFIDWITLSIDSIDSEINEQSGRKAPGKQALTRDDLVKRVHWIKAAGIRFKMNTVVHALNWEENMNDFVRQVHPERWKLFQVLPMGGQNDGRIEDLLIEPEQFEAYINRHQGISEFCELAPELNDDMKASYAMVDPAGRFYDNHTGILRYSEPILKVGVGRAIQQVRIDPEKFERRKGHYDWEREAGRKIKKITLSGLAGAGKSSVGRALADRMGVPLISAGSLARVEAKKRRVSIGELQMIIREEGSQFDQWLDEEMQCQARQLDGFVMDYRLGFHFLPEVPSVFLKVDPEEGYRRIAAQQREVEFSKGNTHQNNRSQIEGRNGAMRKRFMETYGVDFSDESNYCLAVDTSQQSLENTVSQILEWIA